MGANRIMATVGYQGGAWVMLALLVVGMAISIATLLKDFTKEDLLEDFIEIAKALGLSTTAWQPGEPIGALLAIFAQVIATLWNTIIVRALRAGFLDYAAGDWLTLVAWAGYGVFRQDETFATADLVVENRGGNVYTFVPGDVRIKNDLGKTFTNTTGGALAPWFSGAFTTVTLTFSADEAGSGSDTPVGAIEEYPTPPVTAFSGVFVRTNEVAILGADREEDDPLKARSRLEIGKAHAVAPLSAYEAVARNVKRANGTTVPINRVRVFNAGGGVIKVILGTPTGAVAGDLGTLGSDLYLVNLAVQTQLVSEGLTTIVESAVPKTIGITEALFVDLAANLTAADAVKSATAAINALFKVVPIGGNRTVASGPGYLFRTEVEAKSSEAAAGIFRAVMTGSDTELAYNEVPAVGVLALTATLVKQ